METKTYNVVKAFYSERTSVEIKIIDGLRWFETYCTQLYYDGQIDLVSLVEKSDEIDEWLDNTNYIDFTEVGPYYFLAIHSIDKDNDIPRCSKEEFHNMVDWDNLYIVQYDQNNYNPYSVVHIIDINSSKEFICDNVIWRNIFDSLQKTSFVNVKSVVPFDNLQTGHFQRIFVNKSMFGETGARFYYTMLRLVLSKLNIDFENIHIDMSVTWDNYIEKLCPEDILEMKRIKNEYEEIKSMCELIKNVI